MEASGLFNSEGQPSSYWKKKQRFQRYLDRHGVSSAILRGLVSLYECKDKPNDPIRFLCEQFGFGIPEEDEILDLQAEVLKLREAHDNILDENCELNKLAEPPDTDVADTSDGLDEATHELLRRQEYELSVIQNRQECIKKSFEQAKRTEGSIALQFKTRRCKPVGGLLGGPIPPPSSAEDTDAENIPGAPPSTANLNPGAVSFDACYSPTKKKVEEDILTIGSKESGGGDGQEATLVASLASTSPTVVVIPINELKKVQRYSCTSP